MDIIVTQPLVDSCIKALEERYVVHRYYALDDKAAFLSETGPRVRAVAGGFVDRALMNKLPALEIVSCFGVGFDSVDLAAARERNIRVANTPNVLNDAVAELTLGLMIALARRIPQADVFVRQGRWQDGGYPLQTELTGKTLGILGLGRIGRELALRARAMKMRVVYFGRAPKPDVPYEYYADLVAMAKESDWLVALVPGGPQTQNIVSQDVLEALGPEGRFVNMARGSLVDHEVLYSLLKTKRLGGAALDVFDGEPEVPEIVRGLDNVVLSPHQGSATVETRDSMGALLVRNIEAHFAGEPIPSAVI